jgi:Ankyrin repeats (many copies)
MQRARRLEFEVLVKQGDVERLVMMGTLYPDAVAYAVEAPWDDVIDVVSAAVLWGSNAVNTVAALVQQLNAAVTSKSAKNQTTALHKAASCGKLGVLELLLQLGADVSALSHAGWPALHVGVMTYCKAYSVQQFELPCTDAAAAEQNEFYRTLTALAAANVSCRSTAELADVESSQPPSSHNGHFTAEMLLFLQGIVHCASHTVTEEEHFMQLAAICGADVDMSNAASSATRSSSSSSDCASSGSSSSDGSSSSSSIYSSSSSSSVGSSSSYSSSADSCRDTADTAEPSEKRQKCSSSDTPEQRVVWRFNGQEASI